VAKASGVGFTALQRCSFTPNTEQKKNEFSLAIGETPKSVSRNSLASPGEDFWNAAIEFADGISAQAVKACGRPEFDAAEDKSSCAVAVCSKTLPRSGRGETASPNAVGSNNTHQMEKSSYNIESLTSNSQSMNRSPLPVKHFDFCHDVDNQVSRSKGVENAGSVHMDHSESKNSGFKGDLMRPVDATKKITLDSHVDSAATIECQGLFRSKIEGKVHSIHDVDKNSYLRKRDLNQMVHNEDTSLGVYSNNSKLNKGSKSNFSSKEMEASTPTSSLPLKDHSKLSSWLPPELCAVYYKKGISQLYPWQVVLCS
jgi:DNA polymerase theta